MKKHYLLLFAIVLFSAAHAQVITFGSAPFKTRLLQANSTNGYARDSNGNNIVVDTNGDSQIEVSEALTVYELDLGGVTPIIYNLVGIENFTNIRWLNIYYSRVSGADLTVLTHLQYLYCNYLGNLVADINITGLDLKVLECTANAAMMPYLTGTGSNGLSQFPNLERLECGYNPGLNTLDVSMLPQLAHLSCGQNTLSSLNITGLSNLQELICDNSSIASLNLTGCNALTTLQASNCHLTSLTINGLSNLTNISIHGNAQLASLSVSNLNSLQYLTVNDCALTNLAISGAPALQALSFENNQVTSFNAAGLTSLQQLYCYNNQLTNLNLTGCASLFSLTCNQNHLTTLDISACVLLSQVYCSDNNLTSLFVKNGTLNYFQSQDGIVFSGNPNLQYICADENEMAGLQLLASNYGYSNCNVNSYCSFVPGGTYYTVQGSHKFDSNNNGCDAADPVFSNLKFKITSGSNTGYNLSGSSGNYSIPFTAGSYTITPQFESEFAFFSNPSSKFVSFPATASPVNQNFCITTFGEFPDVEVILLPISPARPGFDARYKMVYRNKGNQVQSGTVSLAFDDAHMDLVTANPAANNQSIGNLGWNFTNLLPFENREIELTFNLNTPTETPPVVGGTLLAFNAVISNPLTDITPADNTSSLNQHAVNSFDPNDKTCLEGEMVTTDDVGKYVHYVIRFENTGSFAAANIVVKDVIDSAKFDIESLIPLSGSHPYITRINQGKVEFVFENINLPFDDAHNDGYIAFKIKTLPTLNMGDTFSNTASIYFDYNFPIVTNTAVTTISELAVQDFEFADYFQLYPNPAHGEVNIRKQAEVRIDSISVYNVLGQLVLAVPNAQQVSTIDVSNLKSGNYFIKINSDKGTTNAKFVRN